MEPKPSNLATWIVGVCVIGILAALIVPGLFHSQHASNQRGAYATLKTVASAEADFRGNDRDGNGVQDFWTADLAGLYGLVPPGGEPIALIGRELAEADPTLPGAKPWAGYWFEAMDQDEYGLDYRLGAGKSRHPSKFAFCAHPKSSADGQRAYYVNEGNTVFGQVFNGQPDRRWPTDAELKARWIIID